ncbi:MAG TPA: HAD hydrolase-like protein [Firmicutes bacterium]|nr:HAD hydrolase-like protein [Bacillota bacterium]
MGAAPQRQAAVRAVIFDFDGTLADTLTLVVNAFAHAFRRCLGRTFTRAEIEAEARPVPGIPELLRELSPRVGLAVVTGKGRKTAILSLEAL